MDLQANKQTLVCVVMTKIHMGDEVANNSNIPCFCSSATDTVKDRWQKGPKLAPIIRNIAMLYL